MFSSNSRRFVGGLVAEEAHHQFLCFFGARVGVGVLLRGQVVVRSNPCANEGREHHCRPLRIHQAKPNRLDERASVIKRADRLAVEMPFLRAGLLEFLLSH